MEGNKTPLNWLDIIDLITTKEFDSEIDEYYPVLLKELSAVPIIPAGFSTEETCSKKQNCITRMNWRFLPWNMLFCSVM